ncbi:HK97-gp10 family putative phage morphogenesis protein [Salinicola aestuarinus]|uniref:HK97-gp10 family putative phage morphogenesis protein n=1 Tax=Salinicola aestuarinus TaxID=1949082 RepID=UPI001CB6E545|nr:HK97-gp10 family putative phage morphogenesis protein [Salinicola aestuarinus]
MSFEVEGLAALADKLEGVSADIKGKGGRFALRKAANVVRDRAKESARRLDDPTTANSIADNIVVRADTKHYKLTGDLKMAVGVRGGAKSRDKNAANPGGDTYYWRFLEFGTSTIPAKGFMRTALASSIDAATQEFVTQYGKSVDRAIKRAAKAGGN